MYHDDTSERRTTEITIYCPHCRRYGHAHLAILGEYHEYHLLHCPHCYNADHNSYRKMHDAHVQHYRRRLGLPPEIVFASQLYPEDYDPCPWPFEAYFYRLEPDPGDDP